MGDPVRDCASKRKNLYILKMVRRYYVQDQPDFRRSYCKLKIALYHSDGSRNPAAQGI